uniref:ATP synthase subunit s, mitochondrial n=1 Tax=Angiostrongylus cantonensis TaxID=6313 RepID=A0A0K0DDH1_ANGCA
MNRFISALGKHDIPGLRWLLDGFNYYDIQRVKEVGPDRVAAEWIVRCGGAVKYVYITSHFRSYLLTAELDPRVPEDDVKLTHIHAIDASVTGYGCRHFEGLTGIKEVRFRFCDNLHDYGLEYMGKAVGPYLDTLEIDGCRRITEFGLAHLGLCSGLKLLSLRNLKSVYRPEKVLQKLRVALPKTEIQYS